MQNVLNFGAGPAAIPPAVIHKIHQELFDWQGTGLSILEIGHRTAEYTKFMEKLEASVRRILAVPEHFAVLFLPAGAQVQFAMVAMNLSNGFSLANYVETGHWSSAAMHEAEKYIPVYQVASGQAQRFRAIPDIANWEIAPHAAYLHFTDNETIGGLEFPAIPEVGDMVLVSDMSSNLFSRPIDFSKLGCIYACAQKNFGVAGMSIVMVRRDLLDRALPQTPAVFHYATQDKNHSLLATPPIFACYVASLVFDWIEGQGGVAEMQAQCAKKSRLLYDYLDASDFYYNPVTLAHRSRVNIPFTLPTAELESQFFLAARQAGLMYLEGHRSVGGARASLYNAIMLEDVERLIEFLRHFALTHPV